jgi:hypothetical protein
MITVESSFESALKENEKEWRPTKKQEKFLQVPFDVDEAGYGGALGSGKSDVLMLMPLIYGLHEQEKYKGLFLRRTFPELEGEIIPRSREYFPSTGAIYNESKRRWQFPKGGMDIFGHLEHEKDVKKYDTLQATLIRWDEATSFTGFQYEYLTIRRGRVPPGYPYPAMSRWGSNPGNVGHMYFRKRFIDPYKSGGRILRDSKTGGTRIFIPATADDNPHLLIANPKYYEKLKGISSEAERRAMILGDWYVFEGQVFEEFRLEPLSDEPKNAQHVIPYFPIPSWWPKIISVDWGFKAWCFIIWWAISPEGRTFIYRTYAVKKAKIRQWTRDLALLSAGEVEQVRDIRICWSAVADQGHDQTIYEQVAEALTEAGFTCALTKGEKNRISGKQLVHEYLRWKPLPSVKQILGDYDQALAQKIWRMGGEKALQEYAAYFEPEPPEYNLPKMQILDKSPEGKENSELIECIPACVYDETRKEDVKEFDGDDPYDCLRIGLYAIRDYFDEAKDEHEKYQKLGLAAAKLAQSNDQTAFYRQCEAAEAIERENFSVRRGSFRMSRMPRTTRTARYRAR